MYCTFKNWRVWEKGGIWGKTSYGQKRIWSSWGRGGWCGWGLGGVKTVSENFLRFSGNFLRHLREFPENHRVVLWIVKWEIKIFTIGLQGNYPTIMVHPPIEYLCIKMCNFHQIPTFSKPFNSRIRTYMHTYVYMKPWWIWSHLHFLGKRVWSSERRGLGGCLGVAWGWG